MRDRSPTPDDIWEEEEVETGRSSVKRQKTWTSTESLFEDNETSQSEQPQPQQPKSKSKQSGPFIDESDSEEEDLGVFGEFEDKPVANKENLEIETERTVDMPSPVREEATSYYVDDEETNFDALDEDEDEELREEFLGPLAPAGNECEEEQTCPICQHRLDGLSEIVCHPARFFFGHCCSVADGYFVQDVSVHVNDCLDGKTTATEPKPVALDKATTPEKAMTGIEKAAIARPAQPDPYNNAKRPESKSAFSKMMAGNAEDTAWTAAAAREVSSRGKQAYQRTCPFYKIIPNFSICVDAFRYGAVQDCNAYFLSHFHSDHYVGLTKSWSHGPIYCSKVTANLVRQQLRVDPKWIVPLDFEKTSDVPGTGGARVTLIEANHCPGSALFLFEKQMGRLHRVLHCGDFRASPAHIQHALLRPETVDPDTGQRRLQTIDACYLDTTYLNPKYSFPSQDDVISTCAELCVQLDRDAGVGVQGRSGNLGGIHQYASAAATARTSNDINKNNNSGSSSKGKESRASGRLLVVLGTYSIGKEKICLGIARALQSKIYATASKQRVCACLEDDELSSLLTDDPLQAQIHMQTLFELRADTLADYLTSMKPHFSRVVGFRPTGWTYRPPAGRSLQNPPVSEVLHSAQWHTRFTLHDLVAQRGSTRESACYGVPYSEHSSFRDLTMFCCALRIHRIIPTVNVGSPQSRERMQAWFARWDAEKRKHGLYSHTAT